MPHKEPTQEVAHTDEGPQDEHTQEAPHKEPTGEVAHVVEELQVEQPPTPELAEEGPARRANTRGNRTHLPPRTGTDGTSRLPRT